MTDLHGLPEKWRATFCTYCAEAYRGVRPRPLCDFCEIRAADADELSAALKAESAPPPAFHDGIVGEELPPNGGGFTCPTCKVFTSFARSHACNAGASAEVGDKVSATLYERGLHSVTPSDAMSAIADVREFDAAPAPAEYAELVARLRFEEKRCSAFGITVTLGQAADAIVRLTERSGK